MEANRIEPSRPPALICAKGLSKTYVQHRWLSRRAYRVHALENVDLEVEEGSTVALVGESGSGKSTFARCLALLEEPDRGEIWFKGRSLLGLGPADLSALRQKIQLVFQDSAAALNPRLTATEIISEPLRIGRRGTIKERRERAQRLMEKVGLPPEWGERRPLELSGGQRQRLALARALVQEPELLILDEGLAGMDLSIQAQIANLLLDLQSQDGLTYLYISHNLGMAAQIADEIAVMHQGRIVERGNARQLITRPYDAHTRALVASIPHLELPTLADSGISST